jgi:hypothetical protein
MQLQQCKEQMRTTEDALSAKGEETQYFHTNGIFVEMPINEIRDILLNGMMY